MLKLLSEIRSSLILSQVKPNSNYLRRSPTFYNPQGLRISFVCCFLHVPELQPFLMEISCSLMHSDLKFKIQFSHEDEANSLYRKSNWF